jgi:hypothetical protein
VLGSAGITLHGSCHVDTTKKAIFERQPSVISLDKMSEGYSIADHTITGAPQPAGTPVSCIVVLLPDCLL